MSFFQDWRVLVRFGRVVAVGRFLTSIVLPCVIAAIAWYHGWQPSMGWLLGLCFTVFVYNWVGWAGLLRAYRRPKIENLQRGVRLLMMADGVSLILGVYLIGGVRSQLFPFALMTFLFANVLNPRRMAIFAALMFGGGMVLFTGAESLGLIPAFGSLIPGNSRAVYGSSVSTLAVWSSLLILGTTFIIFIRSELEDREKTINKRSERARVLQRFAEEILDDLPVGVILLNSGGALIRVNPIAQEITGIGWPLELRNIKHIRFFNDSGLLSYIKPVFDGEPVTVDGFPVVDAEGENRSVSINAARLRFPVDDNEFDEYFVLISLQDITRRRKLEEQTLQIHEQLLQTEKLAALGQLAAGVAHELNNPLMGIISSADFLKYLAEADKLGSEDAMEKLDFIRTNARRIDNLSRKLLGYAKPSRGEMQACDVAALVNDAVGFVRYDAKQAGVELEVSVDQDVKHFRCEKSEIEQVLVNLVTNAVHAAVDNEHGKVKVRASTIQVKGQHWLEMKISDNGKGILPDVVDHIWKPFYTTKDESKGSGLGLAIVQTIIERYKGRIRLEDSSEKGTEFLILLPYTALTEEDRTEVAGIGMVG